MPVTDAEQHEADRMDALLRYSILDTTAEPEYDDLTRLAAFIFGAPIALVSLIDTDRQWFKASVGLGDAVEQRGVELRDVIERCSVRSGDEQQQPADAGDE